VILAKGRKEFTDYSVRLLESLRNSSSSFNPTNEHRPPFNPSFEFSPRNPSRTLSDLHPSERPEMRSHSSSNIEDLLARDETTCRDSIERVTREAGKASFDINKDGNLVASLTLLKSSFRLGESVAGIVWMNGGEGKVLKVCSFSSCFH
jgi:RAB6A-GEF complex partner protein 2